MLHALTSLSLLARARSLSRCLSLSRTHTPSMLLAFYLFEAVLWALPASPALLFSFFYFSHTTLTERALTLTFANSLSRSLALPPSYPHPTAHPPAQAAKVIRNTSANSAASSAGAAGAAGGGSFQSLSLLWAQEPGLVEALIRSSAASAHIRACVVGAFYSMARCGASARLLAKAAVVAKVVDAFFFLSFFPLRLGQKRYGRRW